MKFVGALAGLLLAAITALLAWLSIDRARQPYENGRYYDPVDSVVYHEGSATVYGLMALSAALVAVLTIWGTVRLWRR